MGAVSATDLPSTAWSAPFPSDEVPAVVDAVVVGSGPNGLVAANLLADAGWDVLVVEAADQPGGAVRTAEVTAPGFANDLFSTFYPLAAASPVIAGLQLEQHGLRWVHAPDVLANPTLDGPTMVLSRDVEQLLAAELTGEEPELRQSLPSRARRRRPAARRRRPGAHRA